MNKLLFFISFSFFVLTFSFAYTQVYIADSCRVSFFSKTSMENIDAVNTISKPLMSTATGEFDIIINNDFFEFKKDLMKEHFNEDYMESAKYPKTVFSGKINEKVDYTKNGTDSVSITGIMDMHGVKKTITVPGTITISNGVFFLKSRFLVRMADYNIKIPKALTFNLAESVEVTFTATMVPYVPKK